VRAGEDREHSDESASALWDRFLDAYPPEAIPNEHAAQREFFDLYRRGKFPPGNPLLSNLAAWKQCRKWRDGIMPNADKYLREGYWEKPPVERARPLQRPQSADLERRRAGHDPQLESELQELFKEGGISR
jgi:hypothetical protein